MPSIRPHYLLGMMQINQNYRFSEFFIYRGLYKKAPILLFLIKPPQSDKETITLSFYRQITEITFCLSVANLINSS